MQRQRLTGEELLIKIEELKGLEVIDMARDCGYVEIRGDGRRRSKIIDFYNAISEALKKARCLPGEEPGYADLTGRLPEAWQGLSEEERIVKIIREPVEPDLLQILSKHDEYKYAVALSRNTPEAVLIELSKEDDSLVAQALASRFASDSADHD